MKIGFVLDDSLDKADGVQQYVLAMGEWLRGQGHDVHYLVSTTQRDDVANIHTLSKNVAVRFNGNRMSMPLPASKRAIKRVLTQEQFDVLHVQMPYSPLLAQRIIAAAPATTVIFGTFHIVPHHWHVGAASRLLALWTRPTLRRFDGVVSVSSAAQAFAKKTFKLESTVLPNVVDFARFSKAVAFPQYQGKLTIVFLGRLVTRKGCQTLLEAVEHLVNRPQKVPEFQVIICGKGPLEVRLKHYVTEHHLQPYISFVGFVSELDKPRYLRSADIAVFPSSGGESFGIVLIEAMAAGAVVLAGDNSGYRSVLAPQPDLLFAPHDAMELADKLTFLLQETAQRLQVAHWSKQYVQQFDINVVGQQLVAAYKQALRLRQNVQ